MSATGIRVSVNQTTLNTRLDGPRGAPWLVLSNPLTANLGLWDDCVAHLAARFRVLRYDQRGHGQSDVPPDNTTNFEELSADLLGLMDHYEIEVAALVGISMGATTVMRCAAMEPSRCLAVVPCDGQWYSPPDSATMWAERMRTAQESGMAAMARPTVERWFLPAFLQSNPDTAARIQAMVAATPVGGYLACARALKNFDYRADYPGVRVPALFMAGAQDADKPDLARQMAEAVPGARHAIIDQCGHIPCVEQPEVFLHQLEAFLADQGIG